MDDGLKQRLIGAFVLLALAVIFLPAFFDRERMQPVDKKTQIPAAPHIETTDIEDPKRTVVDVPAKPPETMFSPEELPEEKSNDTIPEVQEDTPVNEGMANNAASNIADNVKKAAANTADTNKATEVADSSKPVSLDENGIPQGWVLQVASFKEQARAATLLKKLNSAGYKAFTRAVDTSQGSMTRLYVGPKLNKAQLLKEKKAIEKEFKLSTMLLKFSP